MIEEIDYFSDDLDKTIALAREYPAVEIKYHEIKNIVHISKFCLNTIFFQLTYQDGIYDTLAIRSLECVEKALETVEDLLRFPMNDQTRNYAIKSRNDAREVLAALQTK